MDKTRAETGNYIKSVVLLAASIVVSLIVLNSYKLNVLKIDDCQKKIYELNCRSDENDIKIQDLNDKIGEYEDINDRLIAIKSQYFIEAYKVDTLARTGNGDVKVAYLTFDDGPYLKTDDFLDVLEEYDVLATFFIRKRVDRDYDSIYKRYKTNCHTIGNHTASHRIKDGIYRSEETFIDDILENRRFIEDKVGITTDVMRFPGGSGHLNYVGLSKASLVNKLNNIGYGYVDWNVATGDGGKKLSPDEYLHNVIDNTKDRNVLVILMHDYSENTLLCLPELIEELDKQGYVFLPLWHDSPAVIKGT